MNQKRTIGLFLFVFIVLAPSGEANERLRVVTTIPDLAALAKEVGGDRVEVDSLARGSEDPHFISPTPALMTRVQKADLYVEIGLQLEIWSKRLLTGAGNPSVRVGQPGHIFASAGIPRLGKPKNLSRKEGDLHPDGNPHMWVDPIAAKQMARNITNGLIRISPDDKDYFEKRMAGFKKRLERAMVGDDLYDLSPRLSRALIRMWKNKGINQLFEYLKRKSYKGKPLYDRLGGWLGKAKGLKGKKVVFFHKSWIYFSKRFGIDVAGYVEEKPGISPSARHRDELVGHMKKERVGIVVMTNYYPERVALRISDPAGAKLVVIPNHVTGAPGTGDYFAFMDYLLDRLSEGA